MSEGARQVDSPELSPSQVVSVGADVVSISRLGALREEDVGFLERVFTTEEIEYCESRAYPAEHYAGRWCVKEAVKKIVQRPEEVSFQDVAVTKDGPKPVLSLTPDVESRLSAAVEGDGSPGYVETDVSLSHDRGSDTAFGVVTVVGGDR